MKTRILGLGLVVVVVFGLVNCGRKSNNLASLKDQIQTQKVTGYLVDSGIEGLTYKTSDGDTDLTGTGGVFKCTEGSTITFHLGTIQLGGSVDCQKQPITPVELFASTKESYKDNEQVISALVLLQSLDSDQLHDNGIKIDRNILEVFKSFNEDTPLDNADHLKEAFKKVYPSRELISEKEAVKNFSKTLEAIASGEYGLIENNKDEGKEEEEEKNKKEDKKKEFTFSTITSPTTGRIWLDRNLGAERACVSYDDKLCYGDYYQWGRKADGHEKMGSETIEKSKSTTTDHGYFITTFRVRDRYKDWMDGDDYGQIRYNTWNPCPTGYKVPSHNELGREKISNRDDAFKKLKLPSSGYRSGISGVMFGKGKFGYVSTLLADHRFSRHLFFDSTISNRHAYSRSEGFPVRCVKKVEGKPPWW